MIFIDASALIAVLAQEAEAPSLISRLWQDDARLYSAVSRREAIAGLCRSYRLAPTSAADSVDFMLKQFLFNIVPIAGREASLAFEAMQRFGKGRHPAALNMGDCFAYACAKSAGAKLLYKGNDFALTDLA